METVQSWQKSITTVVVKWMFHMWRKYVCGWCRRGRGQRRGGAGWALVGWKRDKTVIISLRYGITEIILELCSTLICGTNELSPRRADCNTEPKVGLHRCPSSSPSCTHLLSPFSTTFLIFSFTAHAIILKINLAQIKKKIKKNWASWVTQMTSLFLLEDKVFIRSLVGLLQEVSEFE